MEEKLTHRSMKQNREPRNNPPHIWSTKLQQRQQEYTMGKRQSFQHMVLEKLNSYMQKNETRPLSYTIYKNKLKMLYRLKCKT